MQQDKPSTYTGAIDSRSAAGGTSESNDSDEQLEDTERALRFVGSNRWQEARTTPGDEHEYSLPDWATDQAERAWFVQLIAEHGYCATFEANGPALSFASGTWWTYLELGSHRYWCSKVWTAPEDQRPMLNRAPIQPSPQLTIWEDDR